MSLPASLGTDGDGTLPPTVGDVGAAATGTISSDREVVIISPGPGVTFGREPHAHLRIGHAPLYDDVVPKLAGRVFAHDGRVVVANLHDSLALDIRVDGRALIPVPPGHWHAPPERTFDVLVTGTLTYELGVVVNSANNPTRVVAADDPHSPEPPTGARPRLTERQREVLDAYVAPLAKGQPPASHQQVAETLGISRSLVRLECNRIWSELLVAGVPMRSLGDARDQIADAWARHRF
jgi:Sigma-70, region 4